ncbi:MAG: hypothetical protein JXA16_14075, partial [Bacteroidales bacterium]|nr:hypothetical protein [Bacteroidales bacterium]
MIFIGDDDDKMQTFDIDIDIDDDDVMNFNVKSDDSDSLIKIIKIKGNKIWHSNNGNVHIIDNGNMHFFPEMEEHQDILKDAKPGDTLKIKTIASINGKENVSEKEIIISDSINNMHKTIFIQNSDNKQIKKKYIIKTDIDTDKKHKIKKMHKNEDVFFYNSEEESINISITDAEKDDLANIKLPKSYKQLDINDLQITHEENKVKLNFDIINKANTNIKLYDKNGKEIFTDELKKFSGKYTKEIDIDKGEFILE